MRLYLRTDSESAKSIVTAGFSSIETWLGAMFAHTDKSVRRWEVDPGDTLLMVEVRTSEDKLASYDLPIE